jgi:hypothetical protein
MMHFEFILVKHERSLHRYFAYTDLLLFSFLKFFIHLLACAFIVWVVSPLGPHPLLLPLPPLLLGKTCSALFSNFVEEKTYPIIRKTKHFC